MCNSARVRAPSIGGGTGPGGQVRAPVAHIDILITPSSKSGVTPQCGYKGPLGEHGPNRARGGTEGPPMAA